MTKSDIFKERTGEILGTFVLNISMGGVHSTLGEPARAPLKAMQSEKWWRRGCYISSVLYCLHTAAVTGYDIIRVRKMNMSN